MKNKKLQNTMFAAVGTSIIAICSLITVPSIVPFTLQTFAVYCILCIFGGKIGLLSIIAYILLGCIGMPIFSSFNSGFGYLLGATGGYIIGFIFIGLIYLIFESVFSSKPATKMSALILGTLICYGFGTAWFIEVYTKTSGPISVYVALLWCVVPFVLPDIIKMIIAILLANKLKKIFKM